MNTTLTPVDLPDLPPQITSRYITLSDRDGLNVHILEAFPDTSNQSSTPCHLILLLHGFPELAYSWRKVLVPIANAHQGYHVVAPDLRGYGRTTLTRFGSASQVQYEDALSSYHMLNIVDDVCSLVRALGYSSVAMLVGHDFGSRLAGHCVVAHPELFASVVFMSAPFGGVGPPLSQASSEGGDDKAKERVSLGTDIATALAALQPPRKHYTAYFSTLSANADMLGQGGKALYDFLGGYIYMKSGNWDGNDPHPLPSALSPSPSISELAMDLATLPEYYVNVIARHVRMDARITWPRGDEVSGGVYAAEFGRTGFQGALNHYRSGLSPPPPERIAQLRALAGRRVEVPAAFISGAKDWGVYQTPGAVRKMREVMCSGAGGMQDEDFVLIEGAGHWVQQEAPEMVVRELVRFLGKVKAL
ncbi:Alpha/Beta hydrolase protein [Suillus subalutaceus]|uniref:Alpha/Beta hydrolase protein n=1 Tax=Suillus subalutaceus TaxID=48586 RepID=UPI001B87BF77|nr:Alpha/Beta hydrolase protein [Suillus subalutaceus]KAG1862708.1 Alpha/Beta hydrolase protein [Suillus subalutaceus]